MEHVGIKIDVTGPNDGAELAVDADSLEDIAVLADRAEHAAGLRQIREVDVVHGAVAEGQPKPMACERLCRQPRRSGGRTLTYVVPEPTADKTWRVRAAGELTTEGRRALADLDVEIQSVSPNGREWDVFLPENNIGEVVGTLAAWRMQILAVEPTRRPS